MPVETRRAHGRNLLPLTRSSPRIRPLRGVEGMNTQCGTARWHLFLRLSILFFEEWWSFRFARRYKIRCLDRFSKLDERSSSYFFFSDGENIFGEIREIVFQDDTCFVELESGLKEREIFVSIFFLGGGRG